MNFDRLRSIKQTLLDNGISREGAENFAANLRPRAYPNKAIIFAEEDALPPVVFVLSGYLRLYVTDEDGELSTRYITGAGNFVGCIQATIFNDLSNYTCEVIGGAQVLLIDQQFIRSARQKESTRIVMQEIIIRRLIDMMQEKSLMLPLKATERYLFFRERYPDLADSIPAGIVANYIGVRPQSLSRIKNSLK
ncbi:Crp/Fnr family transcriptional regulator [Lewinella sp. IMCC34183]|uniref:Crp/Fnr family transcriptional regulator n=1 Tax=Lewinella sp. IMCC34183 TaxID=2248762 RepID=UPI000E283026|nr:Crp/Fnr family transcriptional regulator [Lewinella sp. IMCC34183]